LPRFTWPFILPFTVRLSFLAPHACICCLQFSKTWCNGVNNNMRSFGPSSEYAQIWNYGVVGKEYHRSTLRLTFSLKMFVEMV